MIEASFSNVNSRPFRNYRDGSVLKSICCSSKGPAHMFNGSQLPVTPALRDLTLSCYLHGQLYTLGILTHSHIHIHIHHTHTHTQIKTKS